MSALYVSPVDVTPLIVSIIYVVPCFVAEPISLPLFYVSLKFYRVSIFPVFCSLILFSC